MTNPEKRREALQLVRRSGGIEAERRLRLMLERSDAAEKRQELVALLEQLSAAFEKGSIAEVAETFKQAEALSVAMTPHKASKPFIQRVVRQQLMKLFGPEVMLMSSSMTEQEVKGYDVLWELEEITWELKDYDQR